MRRAAAVLVLGYGAVLCLVGALGVATAGIELQRVFGLGVDDLAHDTRATFLNQYRFLKAVELGSGVFCVGLKDAILAGGTAAAAFMALAGGGVVARSIAWAVDGRPAWPFIVFLGLEIVVVAGVALHLRSRHAA